MITMGGHESNHEVMRVSSHDPNEGGGYNLSDPAMPFCPEGDCGARRLDAEELRQRLRSPHACELRELDLARRLRSELIYGMPAGAQVYTEDSVPTSRNLPMFMKFMFEIVTGEEDPGLESE
jgi:hypothetical protein